MHHMASLTRIFTSFFLVKYPWYRSTPPNALSTPNERICLFQPALPCQLSPERPIRKQPLYTRSSASTLQTPPSRHFVSGTFHSVQWRSDQKVQTATTRHHAQQPRTNPFPSRPHSSLVVVVPARASILSIPTWRWSPVPILRLLAIIHSLWLTIPGSLHRAYVVAVVWSWGTVWPAWSGGTGVLGARAGIVGCVRGVVEAAVGVVRG